jgi:hypothetical protein
MKLQNCRIAGLQKGSNAFYFLQYFLHFRNSAILQ